MEVENGGRGSPFVRSASAPMHCKQENSKLRNLLFAGCLELTDRPYKLICNELNAHIKATQRLLPLVYGDTNACKEAQCLMQMVVDMPEGQRATMCKRALLLYTMRCERDVATYWTQYTDGSAELAIDLATRVLPLLVPRFILSNGKDPYSFVLLACILSEMWQGETLS